MKRITFKYRDSLSNREWRVQQCVVSSIDECIKIYGLETDDDCEYKIISVEDV